MQHLEDGYLHEIADGEVPSEELVAVRQHLDACESCRARLDQARLEAETARELVELIDVPELAELGAIMEAPLAGMYAAPMSVELAARSVSTTGSPGVADPPRRKSMRWVRPLAWAASLVLAAGIGYASRRQADAALSSRLEPTSIGRIDTVFLDIPAQTPQPEPIESDAVARDALNRTKNVPAGTPPAESPRSAPPAPARQNAAGARAEEEQADKRRRALDTMSFRLDEVVVTGTAAAPSAKKLEPKDANAKQLNEGLRERAANDARDQAVQKVARRSESQPAAPPVAAAAENRLMAKSAADALAVEITFPRAVELLGGRIKLIEGMVPARLEAVGRMVRVVYEIGEGYLVLSQVSVPDSLNWNLSGPLPADSLAVLRLRVR